MGGRWGPALAIPPRSTPAVCHSGLPIGIAEQAAPKIALAPSTIPSTIARPRKPQNFLKGACGARPAEGLRTWGTRNPEGKICLVPLGGRLVRASTLKGSTDLRGPADRHTEPGCSKRAIARPWPVRLLAALRIMACFVNSSWVWDPPALLGQCFP